MQVIQRAPLDIANNHAEQFLLCKQIFKAIAIVITLAIAIISSFALFPITSTLAFILITASISFIALSISICFTYSIINPASFQCPQNSAPEEFVPPPPDFPPLLTRANATLGR